MLIVKYLLVYNNKKEDRGKILELAENSEKEIGRKRTGYQITG